MAASAPDAPVCQCKNLHCSHGHHRECDREVTHTLLNVINVCRTCYLVALAFTYNDGVNIRTVAK